VGSLRKSYRKGLKKKGVLRLGTTNNIEKKRKKTERATKRVRMKVGYQESVKRGRKNVKCRAPG